MQVTDRTRENEQGFTLVEVVVVLAVILLLAGIAVPLVSGYVEDSRRGRAEAEIRMLAVAVSSFYKDVGQYPSRDREGGNQEMRVLFTGADRPVTNPYENNHLFAQWARSSAYGDLLDSHLLHNAPQGDKRGAYATSGPSAWRGPYIAGSSPLDPWGRPYLINVYSSYHDSASTNLRMYLLSAGPNGVIETPQYAQRSDDVAGDDIGLVIHER